MAANLVTYRIDTSMQKIGNELKSCRKHLRMTLPEMAAKLKVSTTTIVNYETGRRMPDIDFLIAFAAATGEDFIYWLGLRVTESTAPGSATAKAWLDKLAGQNLAHKPSTSYANTSIVSVPFYNIKNITGAGSEVERWRTDDVLQFSDSWIKHELGAIPSDLYLIHVDDESMKPTLRSGDTVLLDRSATKPDREGIYLLFMNGVLLVKRLQALPGKTIKVVSDNPAYEAFTVRLADMHKQDFVILGRAVWVMWEGRRM
jgi:phage repressor protein C with HTH and peptisase S24 domain